MRLFVYEYACAQPALAALPESVRREGRAMFDAVLEDARLLVPSIEVITLPLGHGSALRTQDYFSQSDYTLIIAPEFDGILEQLAREAVRTGCRLLGPLPSGIAMTADKWMLYQHWMARGAPTPRTWLPAEKNLASGQVIKKHRYGAGSLSVNWWQPGDVLADHELLQEYIAGEPVSIALLVTPAGRITPLLPARQHIGTGFEYQGGSFLDDVDVQQRVIKIALEALAGIEGLQGYVGVDAILGSADDGSEDIVLEINPRITTSYLGLRKASSVNLVQCMLDAVEGRETDPISWNRAKTGWRADTRM